jgi:hypothetical protein
MQQKRRQAQFRKRTMYEYRKTDREGQRSDEEDFAPLRIPQAHLEDAAASILVWSGNQS